MSVSSSGNMGLNDANLRFYWEIPLLLSLEIAGKCPSSFRLPLLVHHSWATPTNFQANCASPSPIFHLTAQLHFHTSRPTCHHSLFLVGFAPSFSSALGSWKRDIETFHEKQDKFFSKQVDFWAKVHLFFMKLAQ